MYLLVDLGLSLRGRPFSRYQCFRGLVLGLVSLGGCSNDADASALSSATRLQRSVPTALFARRFVFVNARG